MATRLNILRRELPADDGGRQLTAAELKDIRAAGHIVSNRAIAIRADGGARLLGYVWNPAPQGGYNSTGIMVGMKP